MKVRSKVTHLKNKICNKKKNESDIKNIVLVYTINKIRIHFNKWASIPEQFHSFVG